MTKFIIAVILLLAIYPIVFCIQIGLDWFIGNQEFVRSLSELSRKKLLLMIASDWANSFLIIILISSILYATNDFFKKKSIFIVPSAFVFILLSVYFYSLPHIFIFILLLCYMAVKALSFFCLENKS